MDQETVLVPWSDFLGTLEQQQSSHLQLRAARSLLQITRRCDFLGSLRRSKKIDNDDHQTRFP